MSESVTPESEAARLYRFCKREYDCPHPNADEVEAAIAAAEERGRRSGVEEEREHAESVIHVLHQCIRGKCDCGQGQFACEGTARKMIDAWHSNRAGKA